MAAARADRLAAEGLVERMRKFTGLTLLLVLATGPAAAALRQSPRFDLVPLDRHLYSGMVPEQERRQY